MKKYIIQYSDYEHILSLLGHGIPHTNLENVSTVIVDLTDEEYEALIGADIKIVPDGEGIPCFDPGVIEWFSNTFPPPLHTYYKIPGAHAAGFNGTGIKVAILGSGCGDDHAAMIPTIIRSDYTGTGIATDSYNHEQKACLYIGQVYEYQTTTVINAGIAYGCQIYSMKTNGIFSYWITAISDAIALGVDIINCSWSLGGGMDNAIDAAIGAGIIFVCSTGNSLLTSMAYPANYTSTIAVNGVQDSRQRYYGLHPDEGLFGSYITADSQPKVDVVNYCGGTYKYRTGGTSQGTMNLVGLLAIYKQKYPSLNQEGARNLLRRKALKIDGFETYNYTIPCSTKDTLLNYQTGAGFTAPLY